MLVISLTYAILDEIHQSFIPGRDTSIKDILTDFSGTIASTIVYLYSKKKYKNN